MILVATTFYLVAQDRQTAPPAGASPDGRPALLPRSSKDVDDLKAIRHTAEEFTAAFNKGDAESIAALWTEDGDCIDESGKRIQGKSEIEKVYREQFKQHPECKIRIVIDAVRLLSQDAAVEDGRAVLEPPPAGPPAMTKYTAVHVKTNGKWLMSTVRESRIETPSGYEKVADLEWLIGTWMADEQGAKTVSVCRWVANKSFVERAYTVTQPDHTSTSGVQFIGFNAQTGQVQSWNFSTDGGHAVGIWSPRENGWTAQIRGVTGDGTATTAVNQLTKLDDNAYVWQSIKRTAAGQSLPDSGEVILRRQSPGN